MGDFSGTRITNRRWKELTPSLIIAEQNVTAELLRSTALSLNSA